MKLRKPAFMDITYYYFYFFYLLLLKPLVRDFFAEEHYILYLIMYADKCRCTETYCVGKICL